MRNRVEASEATEREIDLAVPRPPTLALRFRISLSLGGRRRRRRAPGSMTRRHRRFPFLRNSLRRRPMAVGPHEVRGLLRCQPDRHRTENSRPPTLALRFRISLSLGEGRRAPRSMRQSTRTSRLSAISFAALWALKRRSAAHLYGKASSISYSGRTNFDVDPQLPRGRTSGWAKSGTVPMQTSDHRPQIVWRVSTAPAPDPA